MSRVPTNVPSHRLASSVEPFVERDVHATTRWFDHRRRRELFTRFALSFERLGDLTGQRGLDIGCGSGPYSAEALRRGAAHVVGIDPAPGMLEMARARVEGLGLLDRVTLLEGSFPETMPAGAFDFCTIVGVLDYVADPVGFFRALRPILTGRAVVSFPRRHWFLTPLRKIRYRLRSCPMYAYDEQQIRAIAEQAGFRRADVIPIDGIAADYHVCLTS